MPIQLLETKLYAPRPRPGVVSRPRLSGLLERAKASKLTVVSAPPGFGKSTLVADWLASASASGRAPALAWLSLDAGDDDVRTFFTYAVTALERAATVGEGASALLEANAVPLESVLTTLLNALSGASKEVVLVLDDYHVIEREEIHAGMAFLLDHLPQHVRLVLITRADPPLPLARLRARGDLAEIRAGDLRFTKEEAGAYLNGAMGLALDPDDVAALEGRTEGWIAALQLAALSVGGRSDVHAFIAEFAGDDRYIVDYLVEEVLERQPEHVQRFLLETSILGRLSGPLCDAVTGRNDGSQALEALERGNLFVIALDDRRRWYRYHHLFADVLRARTATAHPDAIAALHERASRWFEQEGDLATAIEHAIASRDTDRAADLIERAAHDMFARRQDPAIRRWLDVLPDSTFETRPTLAIMHAATRLATGEVTGVEQRLATAERSIADPQDHAGAAAPGSEARNVTDSVHPIGSVAGLQTAISLHRAGLARMQGDVQGTVAHAEATLASAGPGQVLERGGAAALLALASWSQGELEPALARWTESFEHLQAAGRTADLLGLSISIADILKTQGRLHDARSALERGLQIGMASASSPLRGTADMHVGLSEIAREHNDLGLAERHLEAADGLGEGMGLPQNPYRMRVAQARLALAKGEPDAALRLLDDAEARYDADFSPNVHPIAARRARVWIAAADLAKARAWAMSVGVSPRDEPSFIREFDHATLARLLVAEGRRDRDDRAIEEAVRLVERLLASALAGGRYGSAIDLLIVLALAHRAAHDDAAAAADLDEAVDLARPGGWLRVFLDEGAPMTALLGAMGGSGETSSYLSLVRAAARPAIHENPRAAPLVDPLTERELDVLRLLRSDLDGPDIARELHVSLNTVRTHTKNVYAKLGVSNRRAAVRRADELGVFSRR